MRHQKPFGISTSQYTKFTAFRVFTDLILIRKKQGSSIKLTKLLSRKILQKQLVNKQPAARLSSLFSQAPKDPKLLDNVVWVEDVLRVFITEIRNPAERRNNALCDELVTRVGDPTLLKTS